MDLDELVAQLTAHEPKEHRGYLMVPKVGQPYVTGSGVPLVGSTPVHQLGDLLRVGTRIGPAPIDFVGVFLTLDDYVPVAAELDLDQLLDHWVSQATQTELLTALAILNRSLHDQALLGQLKHEFAEYLQPEARLRFENLTRPEAEGRRWFLARQPVLIAAREVLTRPSAIESETDMPPVMAACLLAHTVGMSLNAKPDEADDVLGGHPANFAMEIIRNEMFHAGEDTLSLLSRHVRLWREIGTSVDTPEPRSAPTRMLSEATGADLITILTTGFALWAHIHAWEPGKPFARNKNLAPGLQPALPNVLRLLARTPEDLQQAMTEPRSSWDLLAFQQTPVVDLGETLLVLDEDFLLDRITTGLYWSVHDREKERSELERLRWTQVYGAMVEHQVEESIDRLATPSIDGSATSFDEDDVSAAYGGKTCDRVLDRGDTFMLLEIVSGRLTTASRIDGDAHAFREDTEKLVLKKVQQLDQTGRVLASDRGAALTGHPRGVPVSILPVVVVAGGFGGYPINPMTVDYLRKEIEMRGLLQDGFFDALCVVDARGVEILEGLAEQGRDPTSLLREWQRSSLGRIAFGNWVMSTVTSSVRELRPERVHVHANAVFDEMVAHLDVPPGGES